MGLREMSSQTSPAKAFELPHISSEQAASAPESVGNTMKVCNSGSKARVMRLTSHMDAQARESWTMTLVPFSETLLISWASHRILEQLGSAMPVSGICMKCRRSRLFQSNANRAIRPLGMCRRSKEPSVYPPSLFHTALLCSGGAVSRRRICFIVTVE
jgi:hypothetical protein